MGIDGGGGAGNRINSVIEAEIRAQELGGQNPPDAEDEQVERKSQRAMWIVGGLAVVLVGTFLATGPLVAAIVFAVIVVSALAIWRIVAWRRARGRTAPQDPPQ